MNVLNNQEIHEALKTLPNWKRNGNTLVCEISLSDFWTAITFITKVAQEADSLNHHPEILNVYNRLRFTLTTHDADNQITDFDVVLAARIEGLLSAVLEN